MQTYPQIAVPASEILYPVVPLSPYTGRFSYTVTSDPTSPGNISVRCLGVDGSNTTEIQSADSVAPGASTTRAVDVGGFESVAVAITGPGKATVEANTAF